MNESKYKVFRENRERLAVLLGQGGAIAEKLDMRERSGYLSQLMEKVASGTLKVMILGEFKRGKSTFVNALLGQEILPADVVPCTAVISEVKWGADKRGVLHFRQLSGPLPNQMAETVLEHIRCYPERVAPPLEVPIARLNEYVTIPDPLQDHGKSVAESPFEKLELFWPVDLCRDGVEIIDSPGLNEDKTRDKIALDYLTQIDAVLFVMTCMNLSSQNEMEVIDRNIRQLGYQDIFFICNRVDDIRRQKERERLKAFAEIKLGSKTELGPKGIFFVSALMALEGRRDGDAALVADSGMLELESSLADFLIGSRGRLKLLQPAQEMLRMADEMLQDITGRKVRQSESASEVERRCAAAEQQLKDLEQRRIQIIENVDQCRERLRQDIRCEAETYYAYLADNIPGWLDSIEVGGRLELFSGDRKQQAHKINEELMTELKKRMDEDSIHWQENKIKPLISQFLADIDERVNTRLKQFFAGITRVKAEFNGVAVPGFDAAVYQGAVEGGLVLGAGLAGVGAVAGAAALGIVAVKIFAIPAAAIAYATSRSLNGIMEEAKNIFSNIQEAVSDWLTGKVVDKSKKAIARDVVNQLRESRRQQASAVADEIYGRTQDVTAELSKHLSREIRTVHESVQTARKDQATDAAQAKKMLLLLDSLAGELDELKCQVKEVVCSIDRG